MLHLVKKVNYSPIAYTWYTIYHELHNTLYFYVSEIYIINESARDSLTLTTEQVLKNQAQVTNGYLCTTHSHTLSRIVHVHCSLQSLLEFTT